MPLFIEQEKGGFIKSELAVTGFALKGFWRRYVFYVVEPSGDTPVNGKDCKRIASPEEYEKLVGTQEVYAVRNGTGPSGALAPGCRRAGLFLRHHKRRPHNDERYAHDAGGRWQAGATHVDFVFKGLACRFQVCADNSSAADGNAMKDLHLLSGYAFGAMLPRAHAGGWEVVADGLGLGRIEKTLRAGLAQPATVPSGDAFSLVVHVRKLRE